MKIYEAVPVPHHLDCIIESDYPNVLISYFYLTKGAKGYEKKVKFPFFLDSGAHSAKTIGAKISIKNYMQFISDNKSSIECYCGLDDISDYKKTKRNQKIMEKEGFKPLITFHYGEPVRLLREYCEQYNHICLGGVVGKGRVLKIQWLDFLYNKVLKNYKKHKIHMFGVADKKILLRYPFYSADASSIGRTAMIGNSNIEGKIVHYKNLPKTIEGMEILKNETSIDLTPTQKNKIRFTTHLSHKFTFQKHVTDVWKKRGVNWND